MSTVLAWSITTAQILLGGHRAQAAVQGEREQVVDDHRQGEQREGGEHGIPQGLRTGQS